jgi:LemA protein
VTDRKTLMLEDLGPDSVSSERMRRMKRMMRKLHKEEFESKRSRMPPIKAKSLIIYLSFALIIIFIITIMYNFNRFVKLEERVLSANGHVENVLQRRVNLFENLINLTLNQAALEQEVFRHVADARSTLGKGMGSGGSDEKADSGGLSSTTKGLSMGQLASLPSIST